MLGISVIYGNTNLNKIHCCPGYTLCRNRGQTSKEPAYETVMDRKWHGILGLGPQAKISESEG